LLIPIAFSFGRFAFFGEGSHAYRRVVPVVQEKIGRPGKIRGEAGEMSWMRKSSRNSGNWNVTSFVFDPFYPYSRCDYMVFAIFIRGWRNNLNTGYWSAWNAARGSMY